MTAGRESLFSFRKGEPMTKPNDCLACCVAYALDVPRGDLPALDVDGAWPESWQTLSDALKWRGWYFWFEPFDDEKPSLADYSHGWGPVRYLWIASVSHPSWPEEWAHAVVMNGPVIAYDPARDGTKARPPKRELTMNGRFFFTPLDPGAMRVAE